MPHRRTHPTTTITTVYTELANIRTTPFPEGDPRNETPVPLPPDTNRARAAPAITTATSEWNDLLAPNHDHPDPSMRQGLGYAPFAFGCSSS